MELIGIVKKITVSQSNGFSVFSLKLPEGIEKEIPVDAFPLYGEKEIKVIGNIGEGIELLSEYKVKVEGDFKMGKKDYFNDYNPKLDFNLKKGSELDILSSIDTYGGLLSYITRYISGVGEIQAKMLIEHFGLDSFIFKMDQDNIEKELVTISGIGKIKAKMIKETWDDNKVQRDIMIDLGNLGLSLNKCNLIYKKWGSSYKDKLKDNPYSLTDIRGIGFKLADEVAMNFLSMDKKDERRYAGIVEFLIKDKSESLGDSLIAKATILEGIKEFVASDDFFTSNDIEEIFKTGIKISIEKENIIQINENVYVLKKYYFREYVIANQIKLLYSNSKIETKYDKYIQDDKIRFEKKEVGALNEAQLKAKEIILTRPLSLLIGGAGTGKTYTIGSVIDTLIKSNTDYYIITPTNKAAARVKEINTNANVSTIHSLLGIAPGMIPTYNEEEKLPYEHIIVDETSMLDNNIAKILLDAIDTDRTRITFIGDPQQLPPVGIGSFFYDIINSGYIDDVICYLSVVERNGEGKYEKLIESGRNIKIVKEGIHNIVANSLRILDKKMPLNTNYDCINLLSVNKYRSVSEEDKINGKITLGEDIKKKVAEVYHTMGKNKVNVNKDFQIYIPQYGTEYGINEINSFVSDLINKNEIIKIPDTNKSFKVNEKIVYNETNKLLDLTKGDTGYITDIYPETKTIGIYFYSKNKIIELGKAELDNIGLGYAFSVHKAQGTEVKYGLIILTTSFYLLLNNELLYTAYTRCKEKVYLLGEEKAYKTALSTHIKARNTYLFHLLSGTPKNDIYPNISRRSFGITDSEIKQVKGFLENKLKIESGKIIKVKYTHPTPMNYYRFIFGNKEVLGQNNLIDNMEIDTDKLSEMINNKEIYFIKIKKILSKEDLKKERRYRINTDKNINTAVIEINSFDKDIVVY